MKMKLNNAVYTIAGLVAGVGLTLASVAAPTTPASAQQDASMMAMKAQLMAVTFQLDKSGFHDLDESLAAGTMVPGGLGSVRRARIALMATDWPDELRPMAMELAGHMTELESALRAEDVVAAAPEARAVHDVGHDLSSAVYGYLSGGLTTPAHGDHTQEALPPSNIPAPAAKPAPSH